MKLKLAPACGHEERWEIRRGLCQSCYRTMRAAGLFPVRKYRKSVPAPARTFGMRSCVRCKQSFTAHSAEIAYCSLWCAFPRIW